MGFTKELKYTFIFLGFALFALFAMIFGVHYIDHKSSEVKALEKAMEQNAKIMRLNIETNKQIQNTTDSLWVKVRYLHTIWPKD